MSVRGSNTHSGDSFPLSDVRIVLLGYRTAGKSSAGNTILGREEFDLRTSAQCVKRQGEVAGRQVTVVDTPEWCGFQSIEATPELVKQEIMFSVSLCPPGPHTLLLVINVDKSFTEDKRRSIEEHLGLLSELVWSHTLVLFTKGDYLGDTTIEQHIESEGKNLQWLVEKCGNRYHLLNNVNRSDGTQVTDLLEKIEEVVAGNRGSHYEMNREILEKMQERRKTEQVRVKQRLMKVKEQRETLRSLMGDSLHLPDVRIVLLGYRTAGKSSAGNTILGREEFDLRTSAQCVKRQGEVAGRQVTVVDTPEWWSHNSVEATPELVKQEIMFSVSLCPPGPHTLLLVIDVDESFTEDKRRSIEEHLGLLSELVWSHTIVLFTNGDYLGDTTIEQHIESEGKNLQWLVEKCGNRYHLIDNENRSDGTQVTDLLEKIEEVVAGNRGSHYEMNREILEKMQERRKTEQVRVKQRLMKVKEQRETLRSLMGDSLPLSDVRIVLLGYRTAGKSSAGNTILGREEFDLRTSAQCVKRQGEVAGRQVTVVDTPEWWSHNSVEATPELVKQEIMFSVSLCPPGPHTLLLVINVDKSFTENKRRSIEEHLGLLSELVWSHTLVLFTKGDYLGDTTIEQHIESEGKNLQWLVEKCGNRYHLLNNMNRSDGTQVTDLLEKIEEVVAGNRGSHYEMNREILEKMQERRKTEQVRVKQRLMKVKEQRETLRSLMGDSLPLSDVRIVLLGYRTAGKSSAGNTILGREEFDLRTSAQCVKRQGEVAGRQVTVVDTPEWWSHNSVEATPELVKQEIMFSVSLCPPGPHTLLLVIDVDESFTEDKRRSIEEHLGLLSELVWSHTLVLFTNGDYLGDTTIEQHIESEGKNLQWLVEKCGNRYHLLNNMNRSDGTQVTDLLEKIEEVVAGNRGSHYEMNREILEKMEERRKTQQVRVKQRLMKVKEQRETLRSLMGDSLPLSDLRIVLLGYRFAGKSSAGNTILGREEFDLRTSAQCVKRQGEVAGRQVTVVDTPGWRSNNSVLRQTPELVKQEIMFSVSLCPPGPHTLLLVIDVDESFTEKKRRSIEEHLGLLSELVWSHTIVLFTNGDYLGDTTIEQHIESEGKNLQWLVEKCGNS
ncbi:hypothetical protein DPEC_G00090400 [Dallia pectoralis]|uniref:Uncharacterized protein n=1 Tax=Dallia pectoralis TaxID=75939 RepID=A0ACC2H1D9_DALPE|nr:hypothetical protein DPEC_G00090400 [Dallia pectoralis]